MKYVLASRYQDEVRYTAEAPMKADRSPGDRKGGLMKEERGKDARRREIESASDGKELLAGASSAGRRLSGIKGSTAEGSGQQISYEDDVDVVKKQVQRRRCAISKCDSASRKTNQSHCTLP